MDCMKDGFIKGLLLEGRYKTISPLNHGSFGMVFLAKDLTKNELVAIKCLAKPPTTTPCPEANPTDHLLELLCHDRLGHHPNVVNLLHAFETDSHMFLVLEYCAVGDLYEAIRLGRGPLQLEHVREFMQQLIGAVEFMHAKGLYHRDIKPENIFLAPDGSMKLGDFGLSTTEAWTYEASVGSDRYMAPEQYDPGEAGYNPAQADIWAVGICLLNILFSRNPFVVPAELDVLFADFVRDRQSLFDVFPALSQDAFEVLTRALALDPAKRSLAAMRAALERVLSFTTDEEVSDDEFCTAATAAPVPAATTASRQPLRTPSIQSPPVEQGGAFPWAKALQLGSPVSAHPRQLSAIPDTESNHPDATMAEAAAAAASSFASGIDSALGASIQSITLREPKPRTPQPRAAEVASLAPSTAAQPVPVPQPPKAMASIYAPEHNMSKSWSDLWDEEAEESEAEVEDARRAYNNLNWSSDALHEEETLRPSDIITNTAITSPRASSPALKPLTVFAGGAGANSSDEDVSSPGTPSPKSPAYSPPAKRSVLDKWAALGNRRRAAGVAENASPKADAARPASRSSKTTNTSVQSGASAWRRGFGFKAFSGNVVGFKRGGAGDSNHGSTNGPRNGNGVLGTGNSAGRIGNRSLVDLPTTPGSVGLGLQSSNGVSSASSTPLGVQGVGRGTARRVKRDTKKDDTRAGARVRDWRREPLRNAQQPDKRASVASSRDEVEWVGGWKDLQL